MVLFIFAIINRQLRLCNGHGENKITLAVITASGLLGYGTTNFAYLDLGIFCCCSLKIFSGLVWLDGNCQWTVFSLGMFDWFQVKGIQRVVSKPLQVVLAVCLRSLSCWKANLWPSLRSWALWIRFSSVQLSLNPDQCPGICCWNTPPKHF